MEALAGGGGASVNQDPLALPAAVTRLLEASEEAAAQLPKRQRGATAAALAATAAATAWASHGSVEASMGGRGGADHF